MGPSEQLCRLETCLLIGWQDPGLVHVPLQVSKALTEQDEQLSSLPRLQDFCENILLQPS